MANRENKQKRNENSVKNPGAAVVIYNYKHRLGERQLSHKEAHATDQIILNTASLRKVTTNKTKSSPTGKFEISLAPTKNWVNSITPGSWCVILMSQKKIVPSDTKYDEPSASSDKVKMLGRIEDVRAVTAVDQATGAITSEYVATGEDWSGILTTHLYVDPLIRGLADEKDPISAAERIIYNERLVGYGAKGTVLPTSSANIQELMRFWGKTTKARTNFKKELFHSTGRLGETAHQFRMPDELLEYFNFQSVKFADLIEIVNGRLTKPDLGTVWVDSYTPVNDGAGIIWLDTLLGSNSFWQLIMNNSNHWINDTYPEMRWDSDTGLVTLAIYNRVKPFALNSSETIAKNALNRKKQPIATTNHIKDLTSRFKHIYKHDIDRADIILVNVGTNWRDRYNFVEVNIKTNLSPGEKENKNYSASTKLKNQTFDDTAIGRDGFKPMFVDARYIPQLQNGELDPFNILAYKALNREWFFNIHRLFNGSMTLVGQSEYIAVGDNIMVDADAIFPGSNANLDHVNFRGQAKFLAHVEAISHTCTVSDTGARSFVTEIQFVRGIITDENGDELENDSMIDENAATIGPSQELNSNRVFGTSSGKGGDADPDIQKLKGK